MDVILVCAGLVGLMLGGDLLVRGSVAIARRMGISPLVIGLTLVGFGTSTPELVTSLSAARAGSPGIAIGNVVGSNIGNILLILGLSALVAPIAVDSRALTRDGAVLLGSTCAACLILASGSLGSLIGVGFLVTLLAYVVTTIALERRAGHSRTGVYSDESDVLTPREASYPWAGTLAFGGLVVLVLAADALVDGSIGLARALGVSETVIGLTIVALGTSMPELATSLVAVRRGQGDVAFGNIVGSNIFNILGILGVSAALYPLTVPAQLAGADLWIMLAAAVALVIFAITHWRIGRLEGLVLVLAYAAYLAFLATRQA